MKGLSVAKGKRFAMIDVYKIQGKVAVHVGKVRTKYLVGQKFRLKSCLYPLIVVWTDDRGLYCAYAHELEAAGQEAQSAGKDS